MNEQQDVQPGAGLTPSQQAMLDVWEKHLQSEFVTRSAEDAVDTMVEDGRRHEPGLRSCGIKRLNRVAEDTEQADDFDVIIKLSLEFWPP